MAIQTVPISVNADNIMTPRFIAVPKLSTASTAGCIISIPTMPSATTDIAMPTYTAWTDVAYGNEILLAVSSSTGNGTSTIAASSANGGNNWGLRTLPVDASWGGIAFGNGQFVAVIDGSTTAARTLDGMNWQVVNLERSAKYNAIAYGNGNFITLGWNSSTAQISTDGSNWSYRAMPASRNWASLAYDSCLNIWAAVASNTNKGAYSYDGSLWIETTMTKDTSWNSIASNNRGKFVAVTNALDASAAYSLNGIDWLNTNTLQSAAGRWKTVAYGENYDPLFGGRWVALSTSTKPSWSEDGITWTAFGGFSSAKEYSKIIPTYIPWRSNDTLVINNNATVTVNTDQDKFWSGITINSGTLNIVNTSTNVIRFTTGRTSAQARQEIRPTSGQGIITVKGGWIDLSTGTGFPNQQITTPYTDWVPAIWVETGQDTSIFEIWLNVTGAYGGTVPKFVEGLSAVNNGVRGNFFVQQPSPDQDNLLLINNVSTNIQSRTILLDTSKIFTGAHITSKSNTAIPSNTVIEKIINSSTATLNTPCVAGIGQVDVSIYNPYSAQLTNIIQFGDGVFGNVIPLGAKVRIPNIMLTSDIPVDLMTNSASLSMYINMINGGSINLDTCLIDEALLDYTQSQTINIKNVGVWNLPTLTECYNVNIKNYGMSLMPARRNYSPTLGGYDRAGRDNLRNIFTTATFLHNMNIDNLVGVVNSMASATGTLTAPYGLFEVGYSNNLNIKNVRLYKLQNYIAGQCGILLNQYVNDSVFENIETYGLMPLTAILSSNNTFKNLTYSHDMRNMTMGYSAGQRIGYDPITDKELVDNTPYYFKVRNFFTRSRDAYWDSSEFSATPFLADRLFPEWFSAYCSASKSVVFGWPQRNPSATTPAFEIYKGDVRGFTKNSSTKVFSSNSPSVAQWTYTLAKPTMTAAAGRTLVFDASHGITASTGSFITDGYKINDKLIVTGTNLNNRNYTLSNVSTLKLTVVEPTLLETAYSSLATLTAVHSQNKMLITASPSRPITFLATHQINSSVGDFLNQDGYQIGDVIEITGCTNPINNGTKTISSISALQIAVTEPIVTEATYTSSATITGKPINDGSTYYFVLRKYDSSINGTMTYHDSTEQEVYVHDPNQISTNRILQNNTFQTTWTASNIIITADQAPSPVLIMNNVTSDADLLVANASMGNISQRFGTAIDASYTFSCYIAGEPLNDVSITNGVIMLTGVGNSSTNFTVNSSFGRFSTTFRADASSLLASIYIKENRGRLLVAGSMANLGDIADPPIPTGVSPVTNINSTRYPIIMKPYCRSYGDETSNSGIEVRYHATVPTGTLWTEVYCSSTKGFSPSLLNRVVNITNAGYHPGIINLYNNSQYNVINGVDQLNKANAVTYGIIFNTGVTNNRILNVNTFLNYSLILNYFYLNIGSNNNFVHNLNIGGYPNFLGVSPVYMAANTSDTLTLQNIRINNSDNPIASNTLNTIIKGMSGGNATPIGTSTIQSYQLGSAIDGMATSYIAVYDSIFNELYWNSSTGALHINFTASIKDPAPYNLLSSSSQFANGRLYLQNPSDGIIYTWPHKIYGVSGFRCVPKTYLQDGSISTVMMPYKLNGLDLGTTNDLLEGLNLMYDIDKGPGYTGFRTCTSSNMLAETLSASTGFNLKLKIEAVKFMEYGAKTNPFVIGETIKGVNSSATAIVSNVFEVSVGSLVGTIWVSDASGSFQMLENITRLDGSLRATNVSTNIFALGPSFTSYIDGAQFYTYIDPSILYSSQTINLSIIVKDENDVPIPGAYTYIDDASSTIPYILNTSTNGLGVATVVYDGDPVTNSVWRVRKYGYKPYNRYINIESIDIALPVTLISDLQTN